MGPVSLISAELNNLMLSTRIAFKISAALIATLATCTAQAEMWLPASTNPAHGFLEVNHNKLVRLPASNEFMVEWRQGAKPGEGEHRRFKGVIDCDRQSIAIEQVTRVNSAGAEHLLFETMSAGRPAFVDNSLEARMESGYRYPPGLHTAEGQVIFAACQGVGRLELPGTDLRNELYNNSNCTPSSSDYICRMHEYESSELARTALLRIMQISTECIGGRDWASFLGAHLLRQAGAACTKNTQGCGDKQLQSAVEMMGQDLARAHRGDRICRPSLQLAMKGKQDEEGRDAVLTMKQCLTATAPTMDDRITSADVVAQAIYAKCIPGVPAKFQNNPAFRTVLMQTATGVVLSQRAAVVNQPAPNRPARPAVRPVERKTPATAM